MGRKRYENMDGVITAKTLSQYFQMKKENRKKNNNLPYIMDQSPIKQIEFLHRNKTAPSITWIGHCTFLIQVNGINILTDPIWTKDLKIYRRLTEPGIRLEDLPPIDIVLISHGHYDHLDFSTLRKLPSTIQYLVPIGLKKLFHRKGFTQVEELEWWENTTIQNISFHFVPAQHWTRRTLFDLNRSHWGGWVILDESSKESIYFSGDSGYFRGFKEIGERFSIHYALLPIGAYEPEWFMRAVHMSPEESVQAYIDCKAKHFIPMHYGSYPLTTETPYEALERLRNNWKTRELDPELLHVLLLGGTLHLAHLQFMFNKKITENNALTV
ncbi:MBL fold metallo-hydrolase [Ectobacillus polymachus]|uniref:MBL fold metallo-hydrolase n=1 Tax=Ectobacillus polymachus TaxID=1508806 RepID=UPI003A8A15F2